MLWIILTTCALVAATVAVHAIGLAALLTALLGTHARSPTRFWPFTWLLIRMTWVLRRCWCCSVM